MPKSRCQMNFEIHKINFQPYFTIFHQRLRVGLKWQIFFTLQFFLV